MARLPRPVCHLFCSGREGFSLSSQGEDPHSASKAWLWQNSNNLRIKLFPHCGLLIFSLRQEVGGGVKHYSTAAASQPFILSSLPIMYPRLVSVFIKILKNIPWQKERETVDISANSSLWGCVERSWQGWKEQFPFRRGWEEEFSNQCSAKRGIHLQTCSLRPAVEALRHSSSK